MSQKMQMFQPALYVQRYFNDDFNQRQVFLFLLLSYILKIHTSNAAVSSLKKVKQENKNDINNNDG